MHACLIFRVLSFGLAHATRSSREKLGPYTLPGRSEGLTLSEITWIGYYYCESLEAGDRGRPHRRGDSSGCLRLPTAVGSGHALPSPASMQHLRRARLRRRDALVASGSTDSLSSAAQHACVAALMEHSARDRDGQRCCDRPPLAARSVGPQPAHADPIRAPCRGIGRGRARLCPLPRPGSCASCAGTRDRCREPRPPHRLGAGGLGGSAVDRTIKGWSLLKDVDASGCATLERHPSPS